MLSSYLNQILSLSDVYSKDLKIIDQCLEYYISKFGNINKNDLCFMRKGKRARSLVFLNFWKLSKNTDEKYKTIALLEIIHAASLIHDDVVDRAINRRGESSYFNKFGSKKSILTGDYILVSAIKEFLKLHQDNEFARLCFLREISSTAYGALLEQQLSINSTIQDCLKVAKLKTASIFKLSAFLGSYLSSPNDFELSKKAAVFGLQFGIIFQIQNDLNSYKHDRFEDSEDYIEKNITTPLLILRDYMNFDISKFLISNQETYCEIKDGLKSEAFQLLLSYFSNYLQ